MSGTFMSKRGIVYLITCPLGKGYVGKTIQSLKRRIAQHKSKFSSTRAIREAFKRNSADKMKITILAICAEEDLDANETVCIRKYCTLDPDGYNLRCGNAAATEASPYKICTTSSLPAPIYDSDADKRDVRACVIEAIKDMLDDSSPDEKVDCVVLYDEIFSLKIHSGIRFTKQKTRVDLMDCLNFLCASSGAARLMKHNYFERTKLEKVQWHCPNRRQGVRTVCSVETMLRFLSERNMHQANILRDRILKFVNGSEPEMKKEEHEYKKRKRVRKEEEDKEAAARIKLEHKLKFFKSVGDTENYNQVVRKYLQF